MFRNVVNFSLPDLPRLNSSSLLVLLPRLQWCKATAMKCQMKAKKPKELLSNEKYLILWFCIPISFVKTTPNYFPYDSFPDRLTVHPTKK